LLPNLNVHTFLGVTLLPSEFGVLGIFAYRQPFDVLVGIPDTPFGLTGPGKIDTQVLGVAHWDEFRLQIQHREIILCIIDNM